MSFKQNQATIDLLKIYEKLKLDGVITTDDAMCREIPYNKTAFAQIRSGSRNAPTTFIAKFTKHYKKDIDRLNESGNTEGLEELKKALVAERARVDQALEDNRKLIELLSKVIGDKDKK